MFFRNKFKIFHSQLIIDDDNFFNEKGNILETFQVSILMLKLISCTIFIDNTYTSNSSWNIKNVLILYKNSCIASQIMIQFGISKKFHCGNLFTIITIT